MCLSDVWMYVNSYNDNIKQFQLVTRKKFSTPCLYFVPNTFISDVCQRVTSLRKWSHKVTFAQHKLYVHSVASIYLKFSSNILFQVKLCTTLLNSNTLEILISVWRFLCWFLRKQFTYPCRSLSVQEKKLKFTNERHQLLI